MTGTNYSGLRFFKKLTRVLFPLRSDKLSRDERNTIQIESDSRLARLEADQAAVRERNPGRLEASGFRVFSQSDEDGIIAGIFERIGTTNKVFVEFGAEVGLQTNCRLLLLQGWSGLWIEAHPGNAKGLRFYFEKELESGRLKFLESMVSVENINELIAGPGIRGEVDILSIDIDGNDYHVWNAINVINPRVIVVEHNGFGHDWVMPYNPSFRWDGKSFEYGSSLFANTRLAQEKGYTLVSTGLYGMNGFYVRNDQLNGAFEGPFDAASNWHQLDYDMVVNFPRRQHPLLLAAEYR